MSPRAGLTGTPWAEGGGGLYRRFIDSSSARYRQPTRRVIARLSHGYRTVIARLSPGYRNGHRNGHRNRNGCPACERRRFAERNRGRGRSSSEAAAMVTTALTALTDRVLIVGSHALDEIRAFGDSQIAMRR